MHITKYTPLRDALQLLQTIGRRIQPDALIHASDKDIFKKNSRLVRTLIWNDSQHLPFAMTAIERLRSAGFQRSNPDEFFFYLLNCLTALRTDMPIHDSQLHEFILFFSEFHDALQTEFDQEYSEFQMLSPV